jgi:hypothetical protein
MELHVEFLEILAVHCGACGKVGPAVIPNDPSCCTEIETAEAQTIAKKDGWFSIENISLCPSCSHKIMDIRSHFLRTLRFDGDEKLDEDKEKKQ